MRAGTATRVLGVQAAAADGEVNAIVFIGHLLWTRVAAAVLQIVRWSVKPRDSATFVRDRSIAAQRNRVAGPMLATKNRRKIQWLGNREADIKDEGTWT